MSNSRLPLLIEPEQLSTILDSTDVVIIDLCKADSYIKAHVPGAVHLDYQHIVWSRPPVMGLLPDEQHLAMLLSQTGIAPEHHLVVYDDEGGGKAARLIYTLDVVGHKNYSLLNGGLHAWINEGNPVEATVNKLPATHYEVTIHEHPIATKAQIMDHLNDTTVQLLDARSPAEFAGTKKFAEKGGHIPGARNIDWLLLIDKQHNFRLKPKDELQQLMDSHQINSNKSTIVYCQTHHRSALSYFVLKYLDYPDIKGYPGSWSEWGNSSDTPVETEH